MAIFRTVLFGILLLISCCSGLGQAEKYVKYKDPKIPVETRIHELMKKMTLAEKIGQMAQIDLTVATPEVLKKYSIGNFGFPS